MGRRELLGLIEATSASAYQRITAPMPVITVEPAMEEPEPAARTSSPDFVVKFHVPAVAAPRKSNALWFAISFALSMAAGMGLAAVIM